MDAVDNVEPGDQAPPHRARIQWGVAEISATIAVAASLLAGLGGIIKIAVAQDRTAIIAIEAKTLAEKAARDVGDLQGDLREIKTDIGWIRRKLERGEK